MSDVEVIAKLRFIDAIKRYVKKNGLTDVNMLDRNYWRVTASIPGDLLMWKNLQGEKKKNQRSIRRVLFSRALHTMCCHVRAHAFALFVTVMRSSGEQRPSSSRRAEEVHEALFAVHHIRSLLTMCCQ